MAKDVFFGLGPVALVVIGWLSFTAGQLLELAPLHRFILLGAARVLPQALESGNLTSPWLARVSPGPLGMHSRPAGPACRPNHSGS